ncbi:DUF4178 domain-containing protein [Catellatospora sp. KI3]|uniref:DUF4178 domain-containing protein n=1 Tax=Catellatospora sp. KI3 TaxID=3041620 RepID=UPI0024822BB3|nr:DUF4178 domain-containing protein [Catellatospora sp. KI3]MDI1460786.1 DUF4178 domain-containing protein [Catellatospora sp. KI3]
MTAAHALGSAFLIDGRRWTVQARLDAVSTTQRWSEYLMAGDGQYTWLAVELLPTGAQTAQWQRCDARELGFDPAAPGIGGVPLREVERDSARYTVVGDLAGQLGADREGVLHFVDYVGDGIRAATEWFSEDGPVWLGYRREHHDPAAITPL